MSATGHYFPPGIARFSDAVLAASDDGAILTVHGPDGAKLAEAPLRSVRATSRLGGVRRRLDFPDGARFETGDDDAVDALLRRGSGLLHRLEQSWRIVLISVLLAAAAAAWFAFYGVPIAAHALALRTPPAVASYITRQTMDILENRLLKPTKLQPVKQRHLQTLFAAVSAHELQHSRYRLLLRDAPLVGPNAFALPDGTIVLTDQLAAMVANDTEIEGVFAHEMAHVNRAHTLQQVYQASLVPALIAFVTGDATQAGHIAAILPGILLQSAYSRRFEQEADDDSARTIRGMGGDPGALGDLLQRMEKKLCGREGGCGPGWLGDHPATAERAARLRGAR